MTATPERPARPATTAEQRHTLRLFGGVIVIGLGVAVFAWPAATVQVVAVLFGLQLAVTGFVRAGLSLFQATYPVLHRVLGVIFGVLTGLIGILCLRNLTGSLTLLLVVVAFGWLLDGLAQILLAVSGPAEERDGARIATGLITVLGAVTVLVWPRLGLGVFILIGATVLVFAGIGTVTSAIAGMRARHA